jgi:hypothetical protein
MDDVSFLHDRLRYPGHGLPPREQELASTMPGWSRLARGAPLGQKANILYDAATLEPQVSADQILQLPGDLGSDLDACQIQLVLAPPLAIPRVFAELAGENAQTATGEFGYAAMGSYGTYPGTIHTITWPPFIYVVEWGIGGTKVRAEVDAVNGATVNLTASFVRVFGALSLDGVVNAPGTSGLYTLAAFVGPGFPREGSAQRTVFTGATLSTATSETFAVPSFAKDVFVMGNVPNTVAAGYINFYQDAGALVPVASYFINGNQPTSFRVPSAGAYFQINNGSGVTSSFAAVFGLSI